MGGEDRRYWDLAGALAGSELEMANGNRKRRIFRTDGGFTLLESLITLVVVTSVVMAGAVAMVAMQRSTKSTAVRARLELAVTAYSEAINATTFVPCATATSYPVTWPHPVGISAPQASIVSVFHLRGTAAVASPCTAGPGQDSRQLITIRVVDQAQSVSADIVKRDPNACGSTPCS